MHKQLGSCFVLLVAGAELWRPPAAPGWNRWLIWLAGWCLPAGYIVAASFPDRYKAGLHVTFIGGFAMLALAVSTQVTLGHRGYQALLRGRRWQTRVLALLIGAAMVARVAMEFDRVRYFTWLAMAASAFLAATVVWLELLLPKMLVKGSE